MLLLRATWCRMPVQVPRDASASEVLGATLEESVVAIGSVRVPMDSEAQVLRAVIVRLLQRCSPRRLPYFADSCSFPSL